jgi:16S rRNA (guanine1516-N2)-methyltransferase
LPDTPGFHIAVRAVLISDEIVAEAVARDLTLPLVPTATDAKHCSEYNALLLVGLSGSSLQQTGKGVPGAVRVEFGSAAMRHRRQGGHNELLGKAIGLTKKPGLQVLDATAGLGRDAFILADLGCAVTLCERNNLLAHMLASGLKSAALSGDHWLADSAHRMQLQSCDAVTLQPSALENIEVIYMDPMFPIRDKSASVKKEMALLHHILGSADDADTLLSWALQQPVARIVVKRPPRAPQLLGRQPSHHISGKAVRYDVYVLRGLSAS